MGNQSRFGDGEMRLKAMHESGLVAGVSVDPTPITAGEEITVLYNGRLCNEGRGQVYLHYGYGKHNNWRNVSETGMEKTGWGWVSTVRMPDGEGRFNFCFRDEANGWDNNDGINWSFEIHNGSRRI
ncbi:MAG: carbohydrate-binding protein [Peptococcaceae bacterium]|nr:carbohydrate-binding protein [Peptococcaceae bacterium]